MALEDIIEKIKEDAEQEIARLKKETDAAVERIRSESESECDEINEKAKKDGERQAGSIRGRELQKANFASRKQLLEGRMNFIKDVLAGVRGKLCSDDGTYLAFLQEMMFRSSVHGNEKVILSQKDYERFGDKLKDLVAEVNKKLYDADRKGELVLTTEQGDFDGGFILRLGKMKTVMTMDTIIGDIRDKYESDIAVILTGE